MRSEIYSLIPYIWGGTPSASLALGSSPRGGAKGIPKNNNLYYSSISTIRSLVQRGHSA